MISQVLSEGVAGHILDPEGSWERSVAQRDTRPEAVELVKQLWAKLGPDAYLGYAPFDMPGYHTEYPYAEFGGSGTMVVHPQAYWTEHNSRGAKNTLDQMDAQWKTLLAKSPGAAKSIAPIGVTYGSASTWGKPPGPFHASDLALFLDRYKDRTMSLYSYEAAEAECWTFLRQREADRQLGLANAAAISDGSVLDRSNPIV